MDDRGRAYALHRSGRLDQALEHYQRALRQFPDDLGLRHGHAVCLLSAGHRVAAREALTELLALDPRLAPARVALAACLRAEGRHLEGRGHALIAVEQAPGDPMAWLLLAGFHNALGAYALAETSARRALAIAPGLAEAWHHLGESLHRQERWADAMAAYKRAVGAQPGEHYNIALCAERLGDLEAARDHLARAIEVAPERIDALGRMAQLQARLCDFEGEARSVALLEARLADPRALIPGDRVEAFALTYLPLTDTARRRALAHYAAEIERLAARLPRPETSSTRLPAGDRLRLGYISPDLGGHAVGTLVAGFIAAHDPARVEVFAYALREHRDATAAAIRSGCDHFRECWGIGADAIAARIRADAIEVLVDLGGYTDGARPEVLALRPAPCQLSYLGFIAEQAAPWIDATLLDAELCSGGPGAFSEPVCVLDTGYLPGLQPVTFAQGARREFGLPEDVPLLASFNNTYKLDRPLLGAWVAILAACPAARLAIYLPAVARPGFLARWRELGGDPGRLVLLEKLPADQHARRAACCDLFLDAFRYQAGATGVAAVASGLPVLGVAGAAPLQRLSASLNRHLGLEELVCVDAADYVRRAIELVREPGGLARVRSRLAAALAATGFGDPRRIAAAIERCSQVWRERIVEGERGGRK